MSRRTVRLLFLVAAGLLMLPGTARAQGASPAEGWRPPAREMPQMPHGAALRGDWQAGVASWMRGVDRVSGVGAERLRPHGEPAGDGRTRFVRFSSGPMPVVQWSDRNGDGRADLIEVYRGGVVVLQVVDADFDGNANVLRYLDAAGALVREERI